MEILIEFFKKEFVKRISVLVLIIVILYAGKSMLNLGLLTFLFTYLMYSLETFIYEKLRKHWHISEKLLIAILYVALLGIIIVAVSIYIPSVINEASGIINELADFKIDYNGELYVKYIAPIFTQIDFKSYAKDGTSLFIKYATSIGKGSLNVVMALLLSAFFMFERKSISNFMKKFENSKISAIYKYMSMFGRNFTNSFGKVIQTQIIIAIVNTILSVIALSIMRFPQVLGLGLMIFVLSLVPVAGTVISLIPLSIIAFKIGGLIKVVYVLIMIAVLHALESYVLNPRFMSAKTKLPVFFTFVILLVSEHFMGTWGLLVGIPLFMFILDLINVNAEDDFKRTKSNKVAADMDEKAL